MKRKLLHIIFAGFILLLAGCRKKTLLPDLRESYSAKDTKPFGSNIAFRLLENSFPDNYVQVKKMPFEDVVLASTDTSSLYFCLAKNFYTQQEGVDAILDYVYKGNTFFLASANIDTLLLQRLYCRAIQQAEVWNFTSAYYQQSSVKLVHDISDTKDSFSYFYRPFTNSFSELNETYSRIAGYNGNNEANCIVFFWGKGRMFLHTDPRAFSNYFLLRDSNYLYLRNLLQLSTESPQHVYWDDYYRQNNRTSRKSFSSFGEIMKYPPLATACWLLLAMLLLYILFGMKRRQRIIRQIPPNQNSSVAFTETIARLYLQKKDNKNIADKMITYFNEHIRSNYFLYANAGSNEFIEALSRKSGVSLENTTSLYRAINHANESYKLDDYQLLYLNEQIQQFYKKRK